MNLKCFPIYPAMTKLSRVIKMGLMLLSRKYPKKLSNMKTKFQVLINIMMNFFLISVKIEDKDNVFVC